LRPPQHYSRRLTRLEQQRRQRALYAAAMAMQAPMPERAAVDDPERKPPEAHTAGAVDGAGSGTPSWLFKRGVRTTNAQHRAAMGIDWMPRDRLSQAIPPPYAEFIGREALAVLALGVAA
jgi:hypothetical protein